MKKSLIAVGVIIILGAAYTSASWYTGNIIEDKFAEKTTRFTEVFNQNQEIYNLNIQYSDYQKGIFSTSVHLKVDITDEYDDTMNVFDDVITIHHGPFPTNLLSFGSFSPKMASLSYQMSQAFNEKLWQAAGNKPFITVTSSIDYSENMSLLAKNEAIHYIDENSGQSVEISAGQLSIDIDKKQENIKTQAALKLFDVMSYDNTHFTINNVNYSIDAAKQDNKGYLATGKLIIDDVTVTSNNASDVKLNNINLTNNGRSQDENVAMQTKILIDSITYGQQNLGKGLIDFNYEIDLNKAAQSLMIDFDQLSLQTAKGNLDVNFAFKLVSNEDKDLMLQLENSEINQDNVALVKNKTSLPFNVLAYLAAQISNPEKATIEQQDIDQMMQNVVLLSNLFFAQSPVAEIKYESDSDSIDNGIYIDIYYSKDENVARLKGKEVTLPEFWRIIDQNGIELPY